MPNLVYYIHNRKIMKKLITILFLAFAATTSAQDLNDIYFIKLVNAHRAKNGLAAVRYDRTLDSACKLQADYQLKVNRCTHSQEPRFLNDTVYHTEYGRLTKVDPNWTKRFNAQSARENCGAFAYKGPVFQNEMKLDTFYVRQMFEAWVESPGHNAALLDPNVTVAAFALTASSSQQNHPALKITIYDFKSFATCLLLKEVKK